jgi:transcriptional regulator with XRE-family HTH domain
VPVAPSSKLATRLNTLRTSKKWTYDQLAAFLGVTRSRVHDWCKDRRSASTKNIRKIAPRLRCQPGDLI